MRDKNFEDVDGFVLPITHMSKREIAILAPAKINLDLLVGPRRADGFHPLDSIVSRISLHDELVLTLSDDAAISLTCTGYDCGKAQDNLVLHAAKLLASHAKHRWGRNVGGVKIGLSKQIPAGRGLGGGSSDAAATLMGLNMLWSLGIDRGELSELGAVLGSDIPLFLASPSARMTGRGELLDSLDVCSFWIVLCLPPIFCGTADVYRSFDRIEASSAARQIELDRFAQLPSTWRGELVNDLAGPAEDVSPKLAAIRNELQECTDVPVCMSGSGSSLFLICDSAQEAKLTIDSLPSQIRQFCTVVTSNKW